MLEVNNVTKKFGTFTALKNVTVTFKKGTITGLIGPNGAGKTTLINVCTGFLKCDSGRILFENIDITRMSPEKRVRFKLNRTFQIPNVFLNLTVEENIKLPLLSLNFKNEENLKKELKRLLQIFDLEKKKDHQAKKLSHGDKKILELAIAIATKPKFLFLDEPTAGVNPADRVELLKLIRKLREEMNITFVIVEHDMDVIFQVCDEIVVMNKGEILCCGTPEEIRTDPKVKEIYLGEEHETLRG